MPEYSIGTGGIGREIRRALKGLEGAVVDAAVDTVAEGEAIAVAKTDAEGLADQGIYKNAWQHRRIADGGELRNDAPHAAPIEWGRRPNRPGPPFDPIFEWVQRKLVGRGDVAPEEAEAVARQIQFSIHRKGTRPRFVMRDTVAIMRARFPGNVRAAIRRRRRAQAGKPARRLN